MNPEELALLQAQQRLQQGGRGQGLGQQGQGLQLRQGQGQGQGQGAQGVPQGVPQQQQVGAPQGVPQQQQPLAAPNTPDSQAKMRQLSLLLGGQGQASSPLAGALQGLSAGKQIQDFKAAR